MTEVTNRNHVREITAAGGWTIAWGDLINEGDLLELIVSLPTGTVGAWVSQQVEVQLQKFSQSLGDVSDDVVNQATEYLKSLLQGKRSGEREIGGLGVKAGIVTYHRHLKILFGGKVPLPNNYQPYIGLRVTKPLPPKGAPAPAEPDVARNEPPLNRQTPAGRNLGSRLLLENATMYEGDYLQSENSLYRLILQGDGNVVLYAPDNFVVWASHTDGMGKPPYRIVAQDDGNVVQYDGHNSPEHALWRTGTSGSGGQVFTLQDDRNLVIYANGNKAVWQSRTYPGAN